MLFNLNLFYMKKIALLLAFFAIGLQVLMAQTKEISGTVTSADDGGSIPGVSVSVKGTTLGTITDMDGAFRLKVPQDAKSLLFTFVGMATQEVAIGNQTTFNVKLASENISVEEVVVTAFGIKRKPKEMGVATAKVDNQELTQAGASNVMNGLSAKVSGLQINTINNGVNPDTKITLRGNRHFLASNQALVVLDGVPVSATYLNSVNPNDIENVNILKGASAAALYGNDASNGVLIVTTKKGDKGKLTVKLSNITTFEQVSYMPNLQTRFGGGSGEAVGVADPNYTFWLGPDRNTDPYTSYENQSFGPEFNGQNVILGGKLVDGSYQMIPYSAIKNQKKSFFNTGVTTQNDISVSSGDENSHFYLSAQDVNTTGTIPDDTNRRTGARMAGSKTSGKFSTDYTIGFTQTSTSLAGGDFNQGRPVYWNIMNTPAEVNFAKYKDIVNNPFATLDGYFNAYYPNPYWQLAHARKNQVRDDVLGSLSFSFKPVKWIELSNRSGIVFNTTVNHNHVDEANFSTYSGTDPWGAGNTASSSIHYAGSSEDRMRQTMILTNDFLTTIDQKVAEFSIKGILGASLYSQKYESQDEIATGLVIPDLYNVSNRTGEAQVEQSTEKRNSLGVFADATFGYKSYAFIHLAARNDWDSRLTKNNRSFFYPSADASVILSDMFPTLIQNPVLSFLKVRGGWSKTGQISLEDWYGTLPSYPSADGFPYGGTSGFALKTTLSNPLLRPEQTTEIELGTELSFMHNKIHLEANVYKSNTKDQTIPATISAASGFYSALINAGELENKGLEIDLKFTPILKAGNFVWNGGINYSYSTSKVLSVLPGVTDELQIPLTVTDNDNNAVSVSYATVGEQFPNIKVTDVRRDPEGHIIVDPITGLPSKDPALHSVGHGVPNDILGVNTDLNYKAFRLSIVAEYRGGNVIYNGIGGGSPGGGLDFPGVTEHTALNGRQSFIIPGSVIETSPGVYSPNTTALVAQAGRQFWNNSEYVNTQRAFVTSAAFWKLREVALTYDVPVKTLFGGKVIKDAQVGFVGRNLLMLRPKTNIWTDPEFNNSTSSSNAVGYTDTYQTPPTRTFGFSVKLTF
jgi:TonB-linked SusC/RagA family outer membrane protein